MAADERPEAHGEQKLLSLGDEVRLPTLEIDEDGVDASMEACRDWEADGSFSNSPATCWPGAKQTPWPSKSALPGQEQKGNADDDEDSTTGRMTVDELEHELAVERTKRMEVNLELQESARVGQMLLDRNEQLEQEVLNLQHRLEASRSEAAKDSDADAASRFAEVEWQLQQSARVGQMLLDRNEELEKEVQILRKQAEASRAKPARGSEDSDSEGVGLRGSATSSSRARAGSECSSTGRRRAGSKAISEGSCASGANSDRGALSGDADPLMARTEYLEAENERLREQLQEATHRKHARRRVSTGMLADMDFGHQRTETSGGDASPCNRRRLTSSATDDGLRAASNEAEDVIQGYGGGRARAMTEMEDLGRTANDVVLHEHLQEAIEQNQHLTEECERLEAIVRKQLGRERELTDLLEQERAAAEWAAKEAAREVHGARQAGLDAGLEVVREQRRRSQEQESERRCIESQRSDVSAAQKEPPDSPDLSDTEDASDSEAVAELQERIDELEVKYNEAKHQAWEAHQDMMDLRGLLSAAQVNCQDLEDMAAEKQLALEEEQRRNSSLSEQIQELRHMLEDQRRRQSVLMMCKHAASDASEESSRSGSNNREGTFLDLVHLHRLASRSLPLSVASSRRGSRAASRDSIRSTGVESIRTVKSLGRGASRLPVRDKSLERTASLRRPPRSPRSRLLEDSHTAHSPENSLTLNALLRMEGQRISERPEEEDRASSSVKDQSAASFEASTEKKDLETSRASAGDASDVEDLESRDSSDDAVSSESSSAGNYQNATLDPDVEDFHEQSRALLQALLTVTREKPAGAIQRRDDAEARAAKVRQLFLSDIAKMDGGRRDADVELGTDHQQKSQGSSALSRIKSLQARWQKTFAREVAALADPSQAGEQSPSLRRNSSGGSATDEAAPPQGDSASQEARTPAVTENEVQELGQTCKQQLQDCTDERLPEEADPQGCSAMGASHHRRSVPEGTSSPLPAGRLRTVAEKSSEESALRRWPHANSDADPGCTFFSIASDGAEDYKRKPTEMLDAFLEGVDFPEEAKRHSEPPISLAAEALDVKTQLQAEPAKAPSSARLSWMYRAGWRREGSEDEAAASASSTSFSLAKETSTEGPAVDRRKMWGFSTGALSPSRLFKSTSRANASAAAAQPQALVAASNSGPGPARESDELISTASSSDVGGGCSPSAGGSLAGSPDKAASPAATTHGDSSSSSGRSSIWSFSWGGGKRKSRRLKTLRVAVGGSLDEGSPLEFDEGIPLDCDEGTEAQDEAAEKVSALPPPTSSFCEAPVPVPHTEADKEGRRTSSLSGQCRNCGQLVEYCECEPDASRQQSQGEVAYVPMDDNEEDEEPSEQCGQCRHCGQPMEYCDCRWDALLSPTEGCAASPTGQPDEATPSLSSADTGEHRTSWFQMDSDPTSEETIAESGQDLVPSSDVPDVDLAQEGEEPSKPGAQRKLSLMHWMEGRDEDFDLSF